MVSLCCLFLSDSKIEISEPSQDILLDMVGSFPPCRAKDRQDDCAKLEKNPAGYVRTTARDCVNSSNTVVVMAEVDESSIVGGILGHVLGYEVDALNRKILLRMEARRFARKCQHSMAWKFHIPDPPEYVNTSAKHKKGRLDSSKRPFSNPGSDLQPYNSQLKT